MTRRPTRTYPDLKTYFNESGDTQQAFASRISRSQSWLSKVVNGRLEPSLNECIVIARMARIPLESLSRRVSLVE